MFFLTNELAIMYKYISSPQSYLTCLLLLINSSAMSQQKPISGRTGLEPSARNQVTVVQARARIEEDKANTVVNKSVTAGPLGKSCSTNVGNSPSEQAAKQSGGKYSPGANSDQVVVVKGSVINICK